LISFAGSFRQAAGRGWPPGFPGLIAGQFRHLTALDDEATLTILMNDLKAMVAKAPSAPQRLSRQRQQEVLARLKMGEAQDRIADAYGVDIELIRRLAR
jgi:hypothetical protein